MHQEILKIKVIIGLCCMITVIATIQFPETIKAILPFAMCVVFAVVILYAQEIIELAKMALKKQKRSYTMASEMLKVDSKEVTVRVTAVPHVDYDNYQIPTYLRRQEVV